MKNKWVVPVVAMAKIAFMDKVFLHSSSTKGHQLQMHENQLLMLGDFCLESRRLYFLSPINVTFIWFLGKFNDNGEVNLTF